MAELNTIRSAAGTRAAQIDVGLRAHMNKVYSSMSIGMLITAAAAWAIAGLAVTSDPAGATMALREGTYLTGLGELLYATPLRWVVMFAPLAFLLFGWGALMRRGSAAARRVATRCRRTPMSRASMTRSSSRSFRRRSSRCCCRRRARLCGGRGRRRLHAQCVSAAASVYGGGGLLQQDCRLSAVWGVAHASPSQVREASNEE